MYFNKHGQDRLILVSLNSDSLFKVFVLDKLTVLSSSRSEGAFVCACRPMYVCMCVCVHACMFLSCKF